MLDDLGGHVDPGGAFDALKPRAAVDLHHHRTVIAAQDVDAGHVEAHGAGGAHGDAALFRREPRLAGRPAAMQVAAELAARTLALHRCDHPAADHEGADVGPAGLLD